MNNAGIAAMAPLDQFSLEDFDRMVAVNVRGVFVAAQAAARHMGEGGRIINIGSINADRMPFAGGSVYAMTKAAVAGLTRGLARDLGPRGITVNNVQPGPIDTDMNPAEGAFAESLKALMALPALRHAATRSPRMVAYLAGPGGRLRHRRQPDHRRRLRGLILHVERARRRAVSDGGDLGAFGNGDRGLYTRFAERGRPETMRSRALRAALLARDGERERSPSAG